VAVVSQSRSRAEKEWQVNKIMEYIQGDIS